MLLVSSLADSPITWERQILFDFQALSTFPVLGQAGRMQQKLQLPAAAFLFFWKPFPAH
jgi:hypothetical protein